MKRDTLSNDNRELDDGLDPDRGYTKSWVAQMCDHLKARDIDRNTIASAMLTEMFKMLDGNPFRTGGDEGAIRADQAYLWRMLYRVEGMSRQWDKGWLRLQYEKRPTFQFNRAAPRPVPGPGPRLLAPPPDYDPARHSADLSMLKMRAGHVYTEREVLVRYRRKQLRALGNRVVYGHDRVKELAAAKKRILGWMRRTKGEITTRT